MAITVYLCAFALWVPSWVTSWAHARTLVASTSASPRSPPLVGSLALFLPLPGHDVLTIYTGTRARALFKDPNVFGPFLVPAALIVMHELLEPRLLRSRRLFKLVVLGAMTAGILFSYSRAAWLNLVVGVMVMGVMLALRRGGGRRALVFLGVLVIAAVTVVVAIRVTGQLSFLQERAQFQTYDNQRFGAQAGGIALAEHNPIGIGPGQFELVEPISAHSTYVRALAEEGVLGFVVLVALLYGTLCDGAAQRGDAAATPGHRSAALLAAWCGILANSVFVDTLHWRHLWLVRRPDLGGASQPALAQTSSSAGTRPSGSTATPRCAHRSRPCRRPGGPCRSITSRGVDDVLERDPVHARDVEQAGRAARERARVGDAQQRRRVDDDVGVVEVERARRTRGRARRRRAGSSGPRACGRSGACRGCRGAGAAPYGSPW